MSVGIDYGALQDEATESFFRRSRREWEEMGGMPEPLEQDVAGMLRALTREIEEQARWEREQWLQAEWERDLGLR